MDARRSVTKTRAKILRDVVLCHMCLAPKRRLRASTYLTLRACKLNTERVREYPPRVTPWGKIDLMRYPNSERVCRQLSRIRGQSIASSKTPFRVSEEPSNLSQGSALVARNPGLESAKRLRRSDA